MDTPKSPTEGSAWQNWVAAGGLMVAGVAVYYNCRDVPFLFDDQAAIVRNHSIRHLWPLPAVLTPPADAAGATGRPLMNLSLALNYAWGGLAVRSYHVVNVSLHVLGSLALWGVLRRTLRRPVLAEVTGARAEPLAWSIALLWLVHPLLTESVVCVVQRNEVLAGLFYLLTFYAFERSVETAAGSRRWQALAGAACLAGMASKEVMATAPLLVLLYDRTFVAGTFRAAWSRRKYFHAALGATWVPLAWLMHGSAQRAGTVGFGLGLGSWDYLVTQCHAITLYLKLSCWPHPLVVDYGFVTYRLKEVLPEAVLVVTLVGGTIWALIKRPAAGFLGAWFFVILAPSSSVIPLVTQTMAEHRMYLPLVAVLIAAVLGLHRGLRQHTVPAVVGAALVFGVMTVRRNEVYRDELGFWTAALAEQPDNPRAYVSLGYYHLRRGEWAPAIAAYETAIRLRPEFADAQSDLGSLLLEVGRYAEAVKRHQEAVRLKPADAVIRFNYGLALEKAGRGPAAIEQWQEAVRLRPRLAPALGRLGQAELRAGNLPAAIGFFARAVESDPADIEALAGWGDALLRTGDLPAAAACYEKALAVRKDVAELQYNLGNIRLGMNQPAVAAEHYAEAVRLKPDFAMARHNLALALMRADRVAEAIPHFEETVRQMPGSAQVHHNFALALEKSGRIKEAIAQDEEALRLDPGLMAAHEHLARLPRR